MFHTFDDLPFEILLIIAETDYNIFATMRSLNRNVREYTNKHMDRYKSKFSREVVKVTEPHGLLRIKEIYHILPNGTKYGTYKGVWKRWGECYNQTYVAGKTLITCKYKDGKIHGVLEKYCTYKDVHSITRYDNGIKNGVFEKYSVDDPQHETLIKRCTYENGERLE